MCPWTCPWTYQWKYPSRSRGRRSSCCRFVAWVRRQHTGRRRPDTGSPPSGSSSRGTCSTRGSSTCARDPKVGRTDTASRRREHSRSSGRCRRSSASRWWSLGTRSSPCRSAAGPCRPGRGAGRRTPRSNLSSCPSTSRQRRQWSRQWWSPSRSPSWWSRPSWSRPWWLCPSWWRPRRSGGKHSIRYQRHGGLCRPDRDHEGTGQRSSQWWSLLSSLSSPLSSSRLPWCLLLSHPSSSLSWHPSLSYPS